MKPMSRVALVGLVFCAAVGCGRRTGESGGGATSRPPVPHDTIEIVDNWVRLKQARTGPDKTLGVMGPGETQFLIMGNPTSFMVDNADFRAPEGADYYEIRLGTHMVPSNPPTVVGAATWEPASVRPDGAAECGGSATMCAAGWYGCGPLACDATGTVVGICCGGWPASQPPK